MSGSQCELEEIHLVLQGWGSGPAVLSHNVTEHAVKDLFDVTPRGAQNRPASRGTAAGEGTVLSGGSGTCAQGFTSPSVKWSFDSYSCAHCHSVAEQFLSLCRPSCSSQAALGP